MSETLFPVLFGVPTSEASRLLAKIKEYTPPPGHQILSCTRCGQPVYVGPKQFAAKARSPRMIVGCALCLVELAGKEEGPAAVVNLGGVGGEFVMTDGKEFKNSKA